MAKRDDKGSQPTRRVYKSSDVHKRRVGDSSRSKPAKMPTRREVREATRESRRISAEARIGKVDRADSAIEEHVDEHVEEHVDERVDERVDDLSQVTEETPTAKPKPRFKVIHGQKRNTSEEAENTTAVHFLDEDSRRAKTARGKLEARGSSAPEEGADDKSADDVKKPKRRLAAEAAGKASQIRPRTFVLATVLIIAVIAVVMFAFNRWGRYDDHADIQGTWYVLGTETAIEIGEDSIRFNEEVSYQYEINPREKTISYVFGPMSGQGRYWFSDDRSHLVITDGDDYTATSTTVDDLIHAFLDFSTATGGGVVELPQGEGIIAFSRTPEEIYTTPPAEELYVELSDDAQSSDAAAESPSAEEQGAAESQSTEDGGYQEGEGTTEAAVDETYEEPVYEEEAA